MQLPDWRMPVISFATAVRVLCWNDQLNLGKTVLCSGCWSAPVVVCDGDECASLPDVVIQQLHARIHLEGVRRHQLPRLLVQRRVHVDLRRRGGAGVIGAKRAGTMTWLGSKSEPNLVPEPQVWEELKSGSHAI